MSLSTYIADIIHQQGKISFAEFMQHALYTPNLGYYNSASIKFGKHGDFITAPELSPLFGWTLAQQCAEILNQLPAPKILEFGAGSGALAVAVLQRLATLDCLPTEYLILEVSPYLRERQQRMITEQLPQYAARVKWLTSLPSTPFNGIILANEVLDAMPVERFRLIDNCIEQAYVTYQQHFAECFLPCHDPALVQFVESIKQELPQPYVSEWNGNLAPWLRSIYDLLEQGVTLLIDYGFPRHEYYHPQRSTGTLMCHYQHHAHSDPYINIGLQDITAHVDFTAVAEGAVQAGWQVAGYTHQASFLLANGLLEMAHASNPTPTQQLHVNQAIKLLTLPHEMGELFKVMALTKHYTEPLQGFKILDLRHKL